VSSEEFSFSATRMGQCGALTGKRKTTFARTGGAYLARKIAALVNDLLEECD
jgi:hypothetical protein